MYCIIIYKQRIAEMKVNKLPAAKTALMHVFWSIRGHITYLAVGRICLKVSIHNTRLIPVAMGTTKHALAICIPAAINKC